MPRFRAPAQPGEIAARGAILPISIAMSLNILRESFPYLVILIAVMVQTILSVLATHQREAIRLHDRIREAKLIRKRYLEDIESRTMES